ncbi:hypothetical protein D3C76_1244820 [compost metagenome]
MQLGHRIGCFIPQRVFALQLLNETVDLSAQVEALDRVGQQSRHRLALDMQPPQHLLARTTGRADLLQISVTEILDAMAESAHQRRPLPASRLFQFMAPGTAAVVRQPGLISVRPPGRVTNAIAPGRRILLHLVMLAVQRHNVPAIDPVQPLSIRNRGRGWFPHTLIRRQVGAPEA